MQIIDRKWKKSGWKKSTVRWAYNIFLKINYLFGIILGNYWVAQKTYFTLIDHVYRLAKKQHAKVLFIGVVSRPNNKMENWISKQLDQTARRKANNWKVPYINIFGKYNAKGEYRFGPNRSRSLNAISHKEVAEKLRDAIIEQLAFKRTVSKSRK